MFFDPYVWDGCSGEKVNAVIEPATREELELTAKEPIWQTRPLKNMRLKRKRSS